MADKIIERVARHDAPPTLKAFILSAWPDLSGNRVNGLLHRGQVMLRGSITTQFDAPVAEGDAVAINFTRPYPQLRHQRLQLLYEDDDVAVVNKGYGLLSVSRGAARPEATAYNIVKEYLKVVDPRQKVFIVHRLDRDTSGLMMFAKTPEAKEAMQHNWNNMVLSRTYLAVVEGKVDPAEGEVRSYLAENSRYKVYSTDNPEEGKLAVTRYRTLKGNKRYTMLEVNLDTGRKNQIRVHMSDIGHPISGDKRYGATTSPIHRMALHAKTLKFVHPTTKKLLDFSTPIPASFASMVK